MPLKGLLVNPAPVDTGPGPCASALNPCGVLRLVRTMCVWSSKTNTSDGIPFSAYAAGSYTSSRATSKNFLPNTSFMAMKATAKPPVPRRNWRRLIPSFLAAESPSSLIRYSTCCCCFVWGCGMYSPLETILVGTGD